MKEQPKLAAILAPLGLADLPEGVIRPGPRFTGAKHGIFAARQGARNWRARRPLLRKG